MEFSCPNLVLKVHGAVPLDRQQHPTATSFGITPPWH